MNKAMFKGKSFLLIMPNDFGFYEIFNYNLEKMGLKLIPLAPYKFKYKKMDRIINFIQKKLIGNKAYKHELVKTYYSKHISNQTKEIKSKSIDYILVIRPDLLLKSTLSDILRIGKKIVAYQWDGLERFPTVFNYIDDFDKFYIFDSEDFEKHKQEYPNLRLSSNFYFDFTNQENITRENIFYMGTYMENRIDDVLYAVEELEKYNIPLNVKLVYHRKTLPFINKNIQFLQKQINFFDYLEQVKQAKILLDFKMKEHNGLSLRFFEALKYEKKIITNNASVVNYDFYNPNNIFILHKDNLADLESFLFSDYEKVAPEIIKKYAFSSWLYRCFFE